MCVMADGEQAHEALNDTRGRRQHQQPLRSVTSTERSYARFINRTQRNVDVLWVDFQGNHRRYKVLAPGEIYKINTFVTHPWVFRDSETTAALVVNSEEVFYPKPALREGQQLVGQASPLHIPVYICIPLYSLKDRAAQVVRSCLQSPEAAYTLDIPRVLMHTIAKWGT